jgi:hypothetical protein
VSETGGSSDRRLLAVGRARPADGSLLILLHGARPRPSRVRRLPDPLADDGHRLPFGDLRANGRSGHAAVDLTLERMAQDA